MPKKRKGSGFYHVKAGRGHTDKGGSGRGQRGRRRSAQTTDVQIGDVRDDYSSSPSPRLLSPEVPSDCSLEDQFTCDDSVDSVSSSAFGHALSPVPSEPWQEGSQIISVVEETLKLLKNVLPNHWECFKGNGGFHVVQMSRGSDIAIQRNVFVFYSGTVRITVHRRELSIDLSNAILKESGDRIPLTQQSYRAFVDRVLRIVMKTRSLEVCAGADDVSCEDLWSSDKSGYCDSNPYDESRYEKTFRCNDCLMLVEIQKWKCVHCSKAQKRLRDRRKSHENVEVHPTTRNDYLDQEQLKSKLSSETREKKNLKRKNDYLQQKIMDLIEQEGTYIDGELSEHLTDVLRDSHLTTAQQLFIQQQHKLASCKGSTGMRWHPAMIRFALLLKSTSSAAYSAVQSSGFIQLPSERTLYDYSRAMPTEEGVFLNRINVIGEKVSKYSEEHQHFHNLLFDEIHISQKLVYSKYDGRLIGYVKLNEAAAELKQLSDSLELDGSSSHPVIATKILAYMVKGVTNSTKDIIAAFPTANLSKEELFGYTWDVISACEKSGVKILTLISDGSSVNRGFYAMHTPATVHERGVVFDTLNLCAPDRKIFFVSDPPHLLKTIRNCFAQSGMGKRCTRLLLKNGQKILWKTIERLFMEDLKLTLRRSYKLTSQNVYLNSYTCMKVSYAAQVLSRTVGLDLKDREWPGTEETCEFILKTNDFFDNLNGAHTNQAIRTANTRLAPYTNVNDIRFQELKEYEQYIMGWEDEVNAEKISDSDKAKRMLSRQTIQGIYITINGFTEAVRFLLGKGAKFILARAFNQDPIEQYFSKQRASGGGRHNPTVSSFLASDQKIFLHRDLNVRKRSGNVESVTEGMDISNEPVPKLRKKRVKSN